MPVFELRYGCQCIGGVIERYLPHWDDPNPRCEFCGEEMERLISRFSPVWCRSMDSYNDRSKEGASMDGHWGWRKNGEKIFIDSRKKQKDFCRYEGLEDPTSIPTNMKLDPATGKLVNESPNLSEV